MVTAEIYHIAFVYVTAITECLYASGMVRMCYFNASSMYRTKARFKSVDIDFSLCTHYIYAYGRIDTSFNTIRQADPSRELGLSGAYSDFTTRYASATNKPRRLLSLGGPNETAHHAFRNLTQSEANMRAFSRRAIDFLRLHLFSGLDIDWQYPTTSAMRDNLVKLLQILREDFDKETTTQKLLLTVKCPGVYNSSGYDVPGISRYADYVMLAAYNLPAPNKSQAWFGSPLYSQRVSVSSALEAWLRQGLPVNKAVVGISAVGHFVKLKNSSVFTPGSPIIIEVQMGYYYSIPNGLAYPEICEMMSHGVSYYDETSQMHYLVVRNTWVGYEDMRSIQAKIHWMKSLNISGVMFAGIDEDDFNGTFCGEGQYPLLKFIKAQSLLPSPVPPIGQPAEGAASPLQTGPPSEWPNNTPLPTGGSEITTRKTIPPSGGVAVQTLHVVLALILISVILMIVTITYVCLFIEKHARPA